MNHIKYRKTPHLDDTIRHVASVTQSVKIGGDWVKLQIEQGFIS